jgi:hypothetical protein
MNPTGRLATNHRPIELEASLERYIEVQRRSSTPATREHLVNWCGENDMLLGTELKRVGLRQKSFLLSSFRDD